MEYEVWRVEYGLQSEVSGERSMVSKVRSVVGRVGSPE